VTYFDCRSTKHFSSFFLSNHQRKKNNWNDRNENQFKFEPSIQTPANWQDKKDVWLDTISNLEFDIGVGYSSQEIL